MEENFIKASKVGLRIYYPGIEKGITIEELWKMPLVTPYMKSNILSLNDLAVYLYNKLPSNTISFVSSLPDQKVDLDKLSFDIVKYIIDTRIAEEKKLTDMAAAEEKENKLKELIAKKELEALEQLTIEQLKDLLTSK